MNANPARIGRHSRLPKGCAGCNRALPAPVPYRVQHMTDHAYTAVPLALAAAASFAVSNVAQMVAVRHQPPDKPLGATVVMRLAREPLWLAGLLASILGFVFEAIALSVAPVVLVQPLIVAELPFALPLAALVAGRRLGRREWTGIGLVTGGLMALVSVIRPQDSPVAASAEVWAILFGSVAAVVAVLFVSGHRLSGIAGTSAFAAAAGAAFGLLSVVTKATTQQFSAHGFGALATWQPWALAVVGFTGLTLAQSAYRAGPLAVSLPLLDIGEPLVGSVIAVFAFGEQLGDLGSFSSAVVAASAVMVVAGVATLDRSPLVLAAQAGASALPGGSAQPGGSGAARRKVENNGGDSQAGSSVPPCQRSRSGATSRGRPET